MEEDDDDDDDKFKMNWKKRLWLISKKNLGVSRKARRKCNRNFDRKELSIKLSGLFIKKLFGVGLNRFGAAQNLYCWLSALIICINLSLNLLSSHLGLRVPSGLFPSSFTWNNIITKF